MITACVPNIRDARSLVQDDEPAVAVRLHFVAVKNEAVEDNADNDAGQSDESEGEYFACVHDW